MRETIALLLLATASVSAGAAEPLAEVASKVPSETAGLRAGGPDEHYDARTIFDYLDGGAEMYLAYSLRGCLARRYEGPAGEMTLDLFDMGSSADAFGVFTYDQDGEEVGIGQDALLRPGWLSFWKGRFFVSLTAERDAPSSRAALVEIGRAVAAAIAEEGSRPELVSRLPTVGLLPRTLRYLHDPVVLASHLDLGDGNPLRLGRDTEAALARYRREGGGATLLVVRYPSETRARQVLQRVVALLSDRARAWSGVRQSHDYLVLVVAATSERLGNALLDETVAVRQAVTEEQR